MLTQDDFSPVTLEDKNFFDSFYSRYPQTHSDNTFTNMVCWNHYANYRYAFVEGNLILSSTIGEVTQFRPPVGPRTPKILHELLDLAGEVSISGAAGKEPIVLIDPDTSAWIQKTCPGICLVPDRKHFEYVYLASDLENLPGKPYLTIRHQINKFRKNCTHSVEALSADNREEVKKFLIQWCEWKGCEGDPVMANEKEATFFAVDHYEALGLTGLVVRIDGNVGAISLFERLNEDTALVHFEKGLPECEGIYKVINNETAKVLRGSFQFINRESDLGLKGLREAKMRYHPHHMVEVYSIRLDC